MFPFKKKKRAEEALPMGGPLAPPAPLPPMRRITPTDEVRALSSRGVPEPDIIRKLRRDGYSTNEIDHAMKEALRSKVSGEFYEAPTEYGEMPLGKPPRDLSSEEEIPEDLSYPGSLETEEEELPPMPEAPPIEPEFPEMPRGGDFGRPALRRPAPPMERRPFKGMERKEMEELAEVIVEEKLMGMRERLKTIDTQFSQVKSRIDSLSAEMNSIRSERGGEVKGIEEKIDAYSRSMDGLNGRMESMEKAFKDSLVPMLESMRSLSELVKSLKEKR